MTHDDKVTEEFEAYWKAKYGKDRHVGYNHKVIARAAWRDALSTANAGTASRDEIISLGDALKQVDKPILANDYSSEAAQQEDVDALQAQNIRFAEEIERLTNALDAAQPAPACQDKVTDEQIDQLTQDWFGDLEEYSTFNVLRFRKYAKSLLSLHTADTEAIRNAALEEAATVIELYDDASWSADDYMLDSSECAGIILALKERKV